MTNKIFVEKYEHHAREPDKAPSGWATDASARVNKAMDRRTSEHRDSRLPGMHASEQRPVERSSNPVSKRVSSGLNARFNYAPPGMDGDRQENRYRPDMPLVTAGTSDVSSFDPAKDVARGYTKRPLKPTDDQYTNEHQDRFYDEVTVDGSTGYLERNNYLDRS